jgi:hypothetical protein
MRILLCIASLFLLHQQSLQSQHTAEQVEGNWKVVEASIFINNLHQDLIEESRVSYQSCRYVFFKANEFFLQSKFEPKGVMGHWKIEKDQLILQLGNVHAAEVYQILYKDPFLMKWRLDMGEMGSILICLEREAQCSPVGSAYQKTIENFSFKLDTSIWKKLPLEVLRQSSQLSHTHKKMLTENAQVSYIHEGNYFCIFTVPLKDSLPPKHQLEWEMNHFRFPQTELDDLAKFYKTEALESVHPIFYSNRNLLLTGTSIPLAEHTVYLRQAIFLRDQQLINFTLIYFDESIASLRHFYQLLKTIKFRD